MLKCKLRVIRAINNVTISYLSEKLNIRMSTLSKMENNKVPGVPIEILDKLCTEFNCQIDDIYEYIPNDNKFRPKRKYTKAKK